MSDLKEQIKKIQILFESTKIETFRQGLMLLDSLAQNDKSVLFEYCKTFENPHCMDVLAYKGELRCILKISGLSNIDVQLGCWKTKELSIPGIFCETVSGYGEIIFSIPEQYNMEDWNTKSSIEAQMYNDYWTWSEEVALKRLDITNWETQYSLAYRETDGSIVGIPKDAEWNLENSCWPDIYRNDFIFHGGYYEETILQIGTWEFSSNEMNLKVFLWILILYRGIDVASLSLFEQQTEQELLQDLLTIEIPFVLPNISQSALKNIIHSI